MKTLPFHSLLGAIAGDAMKLLFIQPGEVARAGQVVLTRER